MNDIEKRIASLSDEQKKIFEKLMKESGLNHKKSMDLIKGRKYSEIRPAPKKEYYALSSAQKRMYLLSRMEGEGVSYNMPRVMLIEPGKLPSNHSPASAPGTLDKERLKEVLKELAGRHEALKTSFILVDGEPAQKINPDAELNMGFVKADESSISQVIRDFVRPFDLTRAPLLRVQLVETSTNRQYLMLDMHHIISDGVSFEILLQELGILYGGEKLPDLKIQYKDYSEWQNEFLKSEETKRQEEYWTKTFEGEIPLLNLPTDYQRAGTMNFEGGMCHCEINGEMAQKLRTFMQQTQSTFFMLSLASINVLLSRLTGQDDIVIGTPIAGRRHIEIQNTVGVFLNTLALRSQPKSDKSFMEFLKETKENCIAALDNQDYPFEALLEKLKVVRIPGRSPLFDVAINCQNFLDAYMDTKTGYEGLQFSTCPIDNHTTTFDMIFFPLELSNKIVFWCNYRTSLFKKSTIQYIMEQYQKLMEQILEDPQQSLKDFDLFNRRNLKGVSNKIRPTVPMGIGR